MGFITEKDRESVIYDHMAFTLYSHIDNLASTKFSNFSVFGFSAKFSTH